MIICYFLIALLSVLCLSALDFVFGLVLSVAPNHDLCKRGNRLWAMSGWFLRYLPDYCFQVCDGSCGNWTCPNYHVDSES